MGRRGASKSPPSVASTHPHVEAANNYARAVVAGLIPNCQWARLACQRHLDDLKRQKSKSFGYRFDPDLAEKPCNFIERLSLTKGKWATARLKFILQPWQCFLTVSIFGWVHKAGEFAGKRRFRKAFILIPRKNGKSEWAAAIGLYMMVADREFGAEVYSGATSEKQAWFVFGAARQMALRAPTLCSAFGLTVMASNLHCLARNSKFEPIIGKPGDGASPHCAIVDEYHEHETDAQFDSMETGMGAREQPLLLVISTAGDNLAGPCYQMQLEAQKVLSGVFEADDLFAMIYGIDKGDDWTTEAALRKANPNVGVSTTIEFLQSQLDKAKRQPRKAGTFKTKHLNVWVAARDAFFPIDRWIEAADPSLRLAAFAGKPCYIGLDLASKVDVASMVALFEHARDEQGRKRFAVFAWHFLPEEAVEAGENEHYQGWAATIGHNGGPALDDDGEPIRDDGVPRFVEGELLQVTDGAIIDFDEIQAAIIGLSKVCQVEVVAYDPFQATHLVTQLMKAGVPVLEYRATVLNFSDPMKEVEGLMSERRIVHDGDPVLTWMVSNVTAKLDAKDNVYPRKEAPENKIDGAVALISAYGAMRATPESEPSVYESRGLVEIGA